jgi:hypothetical protein
VIGSSTTGLHVRGHHRQREAMRAELLRGVALGAALDAALARQQEDVVVVEDFHGAGFVQKRERAPL